VAKMVFVSDTGNLYPFNRATDGAVVAFNFSETLHRIKNR
jgi:hypothetical protein